MRFLVGNDAQSTAVFLVKGEQAVNLTRQDPRFGPDLQALIEQPALLDGIDPDAPSVPLADIVPALPLRSPGKIVCLGLNYVDHIKEGGYEIPDYPALFMRGPNSLMPDGAPMIRPSCSEQLDYEVELMVVIGQRCRHVAETDALSVIFGYTVFNDGSVRDYQRKTHQWTPGKNFDSTGAIGPCVVTPDELPPGATGLRIQSRVGDEILQSASTDEMLWPVTKTIAAISEFATLEPGDLIAMGTPPGVAHARKPPRWLRPGEVIETEIEGIGCLRNPVVAEESLRAAS